MTVIELVIERLELPSRGALARLCGVSRTCPTDWDKRLGGGIPSRHWPRVMDEAKRLRKRLSYDELRGSK